MNEADSSPLYTIANLLQYVRTGYMPLNAALAHAAHDGRTVGAIQFGAIPADPTPAPSPAPSATPSAAAPGGPRLQVHRRSVTLFLPEGANGVFRVVLRRDGKGSRTVRKTSASRITFKHLRPGRYAIRYRSLSGAEVSGERIPLRFEIPS